ncbi:MAG: hypothetical protein H2173_00960 [Opitutus sp.]|nr:hypothetical protein [Opitutus sp.]MCS6273729.1 hypothetical protein [Opitutus sp.]
MIRALLQLLRYLRLPTFVRGLGRDERDWNTPVHNGKFASFMALQGSHSRNSDRYDRRLRLQKLTRVVVVLTAALGAGWVALESARALAFF